MWLLDPSGNLIIWEVVLLRLHFVKRGLFYTRKTGRLYRQIQVLPKDKYFPGVKNYHPILIKRKTKKFLHPWCHLLSSLLLLLLLSTKGGEWSKHFFFFPRSFLPAPAWSWVLGQLYSPVVTENMPISACSLLVFICSAVQMSCIHFSEAFQSKPGCHVVAIPFWKRCSWKQIFIVWSPASSHAWQMARWQRSADV